MCGIASLAFYGCSIPIVKRNQTLIVTKLDSLEEMEPIFEVILYSVVAALNALFTALMLISSYSNELTARRSFLQEFMIYYQQDKMLDEKNKRGNLQQQMLLKILPPKIVEQLTAGTSMHASVLRSLSSTHESVCILFADVVGFSSFAKQVDAVIVMQYLNRLFEVFDSLCDDFNVYKIETVGDCYVAAVGVVTGERVSSKVDALGCETKKYTLGCGTKHSDVSFNLAGKFSKATTQSSGITQVSSMINGAALVNARDLMGFAKAMIWGSRKVMKPVEHTPAVMRVGVHTVSPRHAMQQSLPSTPKMIDSLSLSFFLSIFLLFSYSLSLCVCCAGLVHQRNHGNAKHEVLPARRRTRGRSHHGEDGFPGSNPRLGGHSLPPSGRGLGGVKGGGVKGGGRGWTKGANVFAESLG